MQQSSARVSSGVFCEIFLVFVSFVAFVALERPLPRVRPCVLLQITRRSARIVALVTLEGLFSCVLPHHVNFPLTICNAGKLANCAPVRLFPRVGPFVFLQIACLNCSIIALVAFVWFFSSVFPNVLS